MGCMGASLSSNDAICSAALCCRQLANNQSCNNLCLEQRSSPKGMSLSLLMSSLKPPLVIANWSFVYRLSVCKTSFAAGLPERARSDAAEGGAAKPGVVTPEPSPQPKTPNRRGRKGKVAPPSVPSGQYWFGNVLRHVIHRIQDKT